MADSSLALSLLRRRLERIEPRRVSKTIDACISLGHDGVDRALGGGLALGRVHEIVTEEEDRGSAAGLGVLLCLRVGISQAQREMEGESRARCRPFLWLRSDAAQKQTGRVHATGLGELGMDPSTLLIGQMPDEHSLLHAAAEAARCAGLGALLIECHGSMPMLDLTASRRLMLAAEASGVTILLLRIAAGSIGPSAADTRWRVAAAPSTALEASAPGAPAFDMELLRRRAGPPAGPWRVEWDRDRRCFREAGHDMQSATPYSRPLFPLAASGAAQDDMAA